MADRAVDGGREPHEVGSDGQTIAPAPVATVGLSLGNATRGAPASLQAASTRGADHAKGLRLASERCSSTAPREPSTAAVGAAAESRQANAPRVTLAAASVTRDGRGVPRDGLGLRRDGHVCNRAESRLWPPSLHSPRDMPEVPIPIARR
jgi:hypothetical protein